MSGGHPLDRRMLCLLGLILLGLSACQSTALPASTQPGVPNQVAQASPSLPPQSTYSTPTAPPAPSSTLESTSLAVPVPDQPASPTPALLHYEPAGCWQPPGDYTRLTINNHTLNNRTYAMLQQAALLYGGVIDVAGSAIIQGSYTTSATDSLGTHLGGGTVDIAITSPPSGKIIYTDIEPLIRALRTVGFAAWLRHEDDVEPGLGIHIHAVALGDAELSPAAQEQLTGPAGYLVGFDGLPITGSEPGQDLYGGPVICRWMLDAGYTDMRPASYDPASQIAWQERLRLVALSYQAFYPEDAEEVARDLDFLDGNVESAATMCGPLAAAILRDAGLLPSDPGPVQDLKSYWQARPSGNGRPWSLFSETDYEVFRFDTPIAEFDFKAWPLQPADFVYTYAKDSGFEHMFIVTEVDAQGRAYTVTNQYQSWGNQLWGDMLILRYLLYDPTVPGDGIIYNEWNNPKLGRTGYFGFEVMRRRALEPGSLHTYTVRPGDILPELAANFGTTPESIAQANPGVDLANLHVDQHINIPIPPGPLAATGGVQGDSP